MSGSTIFGTNTAASFASTALTDDEKVDVRRFCGYPVYGPTPNSFDNWRFFESSGLLEFRMTNMTGSELQRLRKFMAVCFKLEDDIWGSADNLDTDSASVWVHNRNETGDRLALYNRARRDLCGFMKVPFKDGEHQQRRVV
jgi:hypothetical protein